jgi:plastocyanin
VNAPPLATGINAFEIVGPLLVIWALTVTVLGIRREGFPRTRLEARLVGAVSILLAAGSIGSAVAVGILEKKKEGGGEAAAKPAAGGPGALALTADPTGQLRFDKSQLKVKPGSVTIEMRNPSPLEHNISLEGNGADKFGKIVQKGGTSTITADLKPGTYSFYCSVDSHRQAGMKGTLKVG